MKTRKGNNSENLKLETTPLKKISGEAHQAAALELVLPPDVHPS